MNDREVRILRILAETSIYSFADIEAAYYKLASIDVLIVCMDAVQASAIGLNRVTDFAAMNHNKIAGISAKKMLRELKWMGIKNKIKSFFKRFKILDYYKI